MNVLTTGKVLIVISVLLEKRIHITSVSVSAGVGTVIDHGNTCWSGCALSCVGFQMSINNIKQEME